MTMCDMWESIGNWRVVRRKAAEAKGSVVEIGYCMDTEMRG